MIRGYFGNTHIMSCLTQDKTSVILQQGTYCQKLDQKFNGQVQGQCKCQINMFGHILISIDDRDIQ